MPNVNAPAFDPSAPFQAIGAAQPLPAFDPTTPFDPIASPSPLAQQQQRMGASLFRGVEDIPEGAAQLLAHGAAAIAPSVQPVTSGIDNFIQNREQAYDTANGKPSFDVGRTVGNMLAGAPFAYGAEAALEPLGARLLGLISGGALTGASQPTNPDNFWQQKAEQAGMGAIGGAAGGLATGGVARTVLPEAAQNADVQLLRNSGVTPTAGQTAGGWLNALEQKLTSVPGMGDMIANARLRSVQSFNRARTNWALDPIGESVDPDTPVGRQAVSEMHDKIGAAYDKLLPNLVWQADTPFMQSFGQIRGDLHSSVPPEISSQFDSNIRRVFNFNRASGGLMSGQDFKDAESQLGQLSRNYMSSGDPDQRALGSAFKDVQMEMRNALARNNSQYAPQLRDINSAYARSQIVESAAGMQGAKGGIFSPAQDASAVRSQSKRISKSAFARGVASGQDMSDAAQKVLGSTVPDSGTPGRIWASMLLAPTAGAVPGGEYALPFMAANVAGMGAYTRPVQGMLSALLARRPAMAVPIASTVRKLAPLASAFGGASAGQSTGP